MDRKIRAVDALRRHSTVSKKYLHGNYNNNCSRNTGYFDRKLLPSSVEYYKKQFPSLRINSAREWIKVLCPFHDDHSPSLNLNVISGGFKCWSAACGAKGGNVLDFQMLRYRQNFKQAATALSAWRQQL